MLRKNFFSKAFVNVRTTYIGMALLDEPFCALFLMISFILKKDLGATAFQIAFLSSLRPVVSSLSFYWSSNLKRRPDKLVTNLMGAWFLARVPFFFFPLIDDVWFVIFAVGVYQLFSRASMPALMEILKQNYGKQEREKLVGRVYLLKFLESAAFAFVFGRVLDVSPDMWKYLFPVFVLLSLATLFMQRSIVVQKRDIIIPVPKGKDRIIQPWKDSFSLLKKRKDFARFQWGFMIGGFGLMMIAPARDCYFADILSLSHEQFCYGRFLWMGLGIFFSTGLWQRSLNTFSLDRVMFLLLMGFCLFPLTLLLGVKSLFFFYLAFFFYGIAQAGSHLLWNLSGTYFANNEDSAMYSTVNLHMIGIRGLLAPLFGACLQVALSSQIAIFVGSCTCLLGAIYLLATRKSQVQEPI